MNREYTIITGTVGMDAHVIGTKVMSRVQYPSTVKSVISEGLKKCLIGFDGG